MDDKSKRKLAKRGGNVKEMAERLQALSSLIKEQTELYIDPINKRFPEKYYWLFDGIDMVCGYAELTYNGLVGGTNAQNKGFISNLNDKEACQNANIGLFLKNVLIKNMQLYKLFMQNAKKATDYLNGLDERDPLAKFLQSQRSKVVGYGRSLSDYFDRIIKHPGQIDLLVNSILKNTLETDPNRPLLEEQYALLKETVMQFDKYVGDRSSSELLLLQGLVGEEIRIVIPTRKLITKGYFNAVFPGGEELLSFYLCNDLLLCGTETSNHYTIREHFFLVDCFVSFDEDVITIEDAEKCLAFYPPTTTQTSFTNDKGIREWYDHIEAGIQASQKKHRVCHFCNSNCEYSAEIDESVQATGMLPENRDSTRLGKESLKCIICRGCGRSVCVNCIPCMKADPLQDAVDKTLYCLHCRNWNRRELEVSGSYYFAVPSQEEGEWKCAVNDKNQPQFWYNDRKEVSWEKPKEYDMLDESSYCDEKVLNRNMQAGSVNRLCYRLKDDRDYFYNCDTNQVQWKETMDVSMGTRNENNVCLKCGYEMKNWSVVCPQCKQRWSVCTALFTNTSITRMLPTEWP